MSTVSFSGERTKLPQNWGLVFLSGRPLAPFGILILPAQFKSIASMQKKAFKRDQRCLELSNEDPEGEGCQTVVSKVEMTVS